MTEEINMVDKTTTTTTETEKEAPKVTETTEKTTVETPVTEWRPDPGTPVVVVEVPKP